MMNRGHVIRGRVEYLVEYFLNSEAGLSYSPKFGKQCLSLQFYAQPCFTSIIEILNLYIYHSLYLLTKIGRITPPGIAIRQKLADSPITL